MIRSKIAQLLGRSPGSGSKFVVIAYDHVGHYFHELLGYNDRGERTRDFASHHSGQVG